MGRKVRTLCLPLLLGLISAVGLVSGCLGFADNNAMQAVAAPELGQHIEVLPLKSVWEMLGQVNQDRALSDLRQLTGEEPICAGTDCYLINNRLTGSEGLHLATNYIAQELVGLGYAVSFQDWSRSGHADRNVIARKPGAYAPDEVICLVAHLDGVRPDTAQRYPAADDDASGVADNLELARVFSRYTFSRTLVLLFTTGEEQGTLGVRSYLDHLSAAELASIKYAVDVDMVGYDGNHDGVMELWHGGDAPSMAVTEMMSETIRTYQLGLKASLVVGCG